MIRGINCQIPNDYGTYLKDILKTFDVTKYSWRIGAGESYKLVENNIEPLFPEGRLELEGSELKEIIETDIHYLIFVDLQAYPKENLSEIKTYEEFMNSDCELVVNVVDSSYTDIYCKDKRILEKFYRQFQENGYEKINYITDENDTRTCLVAW